MQDDGYTNFDELPKEKDKDVRSDGIQKPGDRWLCPVCRAYDISQRHAEICNGAERSFSLAVDMSPGEVKKIFYVRRIQDAR